MFVDFLCLVSCLTIITILMQNKLYCAGTTAKVSFIVTGDQDETLPRVVEDEKRPILQRNSIDSFIMAVPRPLGTLTHLRYIYIHPIAMFFSGRERCTCLCVSYSQPQLICQKTDVVYFHTFKPLLVCESKTRTSK